MLEKLDRAVNLRLSASIYEKLVNEAKQSGRKLSDHIRYVLEQGLQILPQDDPPGKDPPGKDPPGKDQISELQERLRRLEHLTHRSNQSRSPRKKRGPRAR